MIYTFQLRLCFLIFYLILGIVQIAFGFAGSYYTLIVCGMLLIFKAVSIVASNSKKVLRSTICTSFILICAYMIYYSFYMFTAELDYASVRPQIWLIIPIVLNFIIFLIMFLSAYDSVPTSCLAIHCFLFSSHNSTVQYRLPLIH